MVPSLLVLMVPSLLVLMMPSLLVVMVPSLLVLNNQLNNKIWTPWTINMSVITFYEVVCPKGIQVSWFHTVYDWGISP